MTRRTPGAATGAPELDTPWRDRRLTPSERAAALGAAMTLEGKIAQLVGQRVGS